MSDMADLLERYNDCCERLSEAERERDEYGVSLQLWAARASGAEKERNHFEAQLGRLADVAEWTERLVAVVEQYLETGRGDIDGVLEATRTVCAAALAGREERQWK